MISGWHAHTHTGTKSSKKWVPYVHIISTDKQKRNDHSNFSHDFLFGSIYLQLHWRSFFSAAQFHFFITTRWPVDYSQDGWENAFWGNGGNVSWKSAHFLNMRAPPHTQLCLSQFDFSKLAYSTRTYRGKNATCSNIFYYPGFYHHDQDGYTNEEAGVTLGFDMYCLEMGTGDVVYDFTVNNFATQELNEFLCSCSWEDFEKWVHLEWIWRHSYATFFVENRITLVAYHCILLSHRKSGWALKLR